MLHMLQSLAYGFIWNSQREVAYKMILPREEGGMGVRDFAQQNEATTMMQTNKIWLQTNKICASWFSCHCIKDLPFNDITKRYNDSTKWNHLLQNCGTTTRCINCNSNGKVAWKGIGGTPSIANVINTLRVCNALDSMAKGIWAAMIPKVALLLWRIRW